MVAHKKNREIERKQLTEQYKLTNISYNVTKTIATLSKLFSNLSTRYQLSIAGTICEQVYSSAMAERPRELGDFKGMGHFQAKF